MRRGIIFVCALLIGGMLNAKVKLPALWGDGMVLQQQAIVKLSGTTVPDKEVSVSVPWSLNTLTTISDKNTGKWSVDIATPQAGGPYEIKIIDGDTLTIKDVLIGEVWICSGQSNMEMPVKGFRGQPVWESQETILAADSTRNIRLFTVKRGYSSVPEDDVTGKWEKSAPEAVSNFSAVGYFYGELLNRILNIPVGVIHSSWSASNIETWCSKETLGEFEEIGLEGISATNKNPNIVPTLLYNAMLHPLRDYGIKGMIWYQGESNTANPNLYQRLFTAWVEQNRKLFKNPALPIYYTEIAPIASPVTDPLQRAIFREKQLESMYQIPNVGMAFTGDLGSEKFIHAPQKKEIGHRLAYWALAKTYHVKGIAYAGPVFRSCLKKDGKFELIFDFADEGLNPENERVKGFQMAGSDGIFHEAQAEIVSGTSRVKVWCDSVDNPVELRYAFRNYMKGSLKNNAGLPAASFRVDLSDKAVANPLALGWKDVSASFHLPEYLKLYQSPVWLEGTRSHAYIAVLDANSKDKLLVTGSKTLQTPFRFYKQENAPSVILNAGFFNKDGSVSSICSDGKFIADNLPVVGRKWNGVMHTYYPTRSVFNFSDKNCSVGWVYQQNQKRYIYQLPSFNDIFAYPKPKPSEKYPAEPSSWNPENAIGGGPVLVKDGIICNTWAEELLDNAGGILPMECHPRSAIGVTTDGKIILFSCEGRNKEQKIPGLNLYQLARVMKSLGCVNAMNLDGGGSSCLLINGKPVFAPSDGKQRAVASVLIVK